MDTDWLNRWLTLAANVGVIAGIVFFAVELRQNTASIRAQSRTEMSQGAIQLLTQSVNDKTYVDTMYRGFRGDDLDDVEKEQLYRTLTAWTQYWNNLAYLHQAGLYDDAEFALQISVIRDELDYLAGWKAHWCKTREWNANPALIEAIEGSSNGNFCEE